MVCPCFPSPTAGLEPLAAGTPESWNLLLDCKAGFIHTIYIYNVSEWYNHHDPSMIYIISNIIYIYHTPSMISRHIFRSSWSNPIISPVGFPFRQVAASGESAKPGWPGFMWWYNMIYPLVMTNSLLLKMAIYSGFSMIFPWKMVIFHSYVNVYQRV